MASWEITTFRGAPPKYWMWYYEGREFTAEDIGSAVGFVYIIQNLADGRRYVGKKNFTKAKTLQPLKGKKRKRRSRVESNWQDYYGSNEYLEADVEKFGKENFRREIIRICMSKAEMSYWEAHHQFALGVLLAPTQFYNRWVNVKTHGSILLRTPTKK